jgi:hypothetical protein
VVNEVKFNDISRSPLCADFKAFQSTRHFVFLIIYHGALA